MNHEIIFSGVGLASFAGWGALALAPLRRPLLLKVARGIGVCLALAYAAILAVAWDSPPVGDFGSLAGVGRGFGNPGHLLAAWVHFLAFDLSIGSWEVEQAERYGIPHLLLLPCLALTFLFGPLGLLVFLAVRQLQGGWVRARASKV